MDRGTEKGRQRYWRNENTADIGTEDRVSGHVEGEATRTKMVLLGNRPKMEREGISRKYWLYGVNAENQEQIENENIN